MADDERRGEVDRLLFVIETQRLINAATLDPQDVMQIVTERAQQATNSDGGVVELAEDGEMVYRAVSGIAAGSLDTRLAISGSLSGLCVQQKIPLVCDDTETDDRVDRDACRRVGVRSMIVVPLVHHGDAMGVLKVMSAETGHFEVADAEILELMGGFIAASLTNSFTYQLESHRALHDPLTDLPNRTLLLDRIGHALYEATRYGGSFGLFFIDLDGFKTVNDTLGHDAGDDVLRGVARTLLPMLRAGDTLARLGGDEFVVLCENASEDIEAQIRDRIDTAIATVTEEIGLNAEDFGASVGVMWSSGDAASADQLLKAADESMYRVKRARRSGSGRTG